MILEDRLFCSVYAQTTSCVPFTFVTVDVCLSVCSHLLCECTTVLNLWQLMSEFSHGFNFLAAKRSCTEDNFFSEYLYLNILGIFSFEGVKFLSSQLIYEHRYWIILTVFIRLKICIEISQIFFFRMVFNCFNICLLRYLKKNRNRYT